MGAPIIIKYYAATLSFNYDSFIAEDVPIEPALPLRVKQLPQALTARFVVVQQRELYIKISN